MLRPVFRHLESFPTPPLRSGVLHGASRIPWSSFEEGKDGEERERQLGEAFCFRFLYGGVDSSLGPESTKASSISLGSP